MQPMTKHHLKNAALHPIHAVKSVWSSVTRKPITFKDDFSMRICALQFADKNNFTPAERKELNKILSSNILFFTAVGDANNARSMLFIKSHVRIVAEVPKKVEVSQCSDLSVGYVVRAKATEAFPNRIEEKPSVFEDYDFNSLLKSFLGKTARDKTNFCNSSLLISVARGTLVIDNDFRKLRSFFTQPLFGME